VIGAGDLPGNSDLLVGGDRKSNRSFDSIIMMMFVVLTVLLGLLVEDELGARRRVIKIGVLRTIATLLSWVHTNWGLMIIRTVG
jgi:hypothetical protein